MASVPVNVENKGSMWDLDHNLDQSMDEEAGRLRNMYQEKYSNMDVYDFSVLSASGGIKVEDPNITNGRVHL
ncbi:hypothetical protein B296_00018308 [Ensete ventricosum]|uniref:Uncharacterized protein n=1 Tax=Ensete ventricosum TaxID=4639 RepID=A0A427AWN9_ENSVE|nr:hypothetical protein B296_00018308 [Ensete ventricosum]